MKTHHSLRKTKKTLLQEILSYLKAVWAEMKDFLMTLLIYGLLFGVVVYIAIWLAQLVFQALQEGLVR